MIPWYFISFINRNGKGKTWKVAMRRLNRIKSVKMGKVIKISQEKISVQNSKKNFLVLCDVYT